MTDTNQAPFVYATYPDLAGKRVVLAGGATELGDALNAAFAQQGARVWHLGDTADTNAIGAAFAAVEQEAGGVEILLNTVRPGPRGAAWNDAMAAELRALFFCCQAALAGMRKRDGGVILNIGAMPPATASAADEALVGLTRGIARDLGGAGVRAAAVLPAAMAARWDGLAPGTPPRIEAEDVAAMALFLASSNGRRCRGPE